MPEADVSPTIATHLLSGLFTSLPIFLGGVINSIVVAAVAASRHQTGLFVAWLLVELVLGHARLTVLTVARRARRTGDEQPVTIAILLSCCWAASVGFGAYISIASHDWVLAVISCVSAAGMVSGICLRNFGTPRLVVVMMVLSLGPFAMAALFSPEPALLIISIQLPILMAAIGSAAFRLNSLMVARMSTQEKLELSEAFNRSILESSPDYTLLLNDEGRIVFCNRPQAGHSGTEAIIGGIWLEMLPAENREEGRRALDCARSGETPRLSIRHADPNGHRWFDLAISRVCDRSSRILIVARDISHQKDSEQRALWMANHDPLTGLSNRIVLQNRLEALSSGARKSDSCALLVLDIDNFKLINDTLGHDAGDALLCTFAGKLRTAVRSGDLVVRLGGDEFAILLQALSEEDIEAAAERIFAELHQPIAHDGRVLDCNASIGACLYPRDATGRSELMKAADIALYSAKAAGRGQLKIFQPAMRAGVQSRSAMMLMARDALASEDVLPHYQPKVCLRTGRIMGFEALLRWRDASGGLRLPEELQAAFEDPALSAAISDRMIERSLADVRRWLHEGVRFGHVAINCAAAAFRSGKLADELLERLEAEGIPPRRLQVEVTETVFLGRGADHVKEALRRLSTAGVRIALDDFGTGYASLAHLMQFPVDTLKIDRSFIRGLGRNSEAEAITKAIVNLGQSLGIEIIAEGVETSEQEIHLIGLGCQTAQGYLYSHAVAAETVTDMLIGSVAKSA